MDQNKWEQETLSQLKMGKKKVLWKGAYAKVNEEILADGSEVYNVEVGRDGKTVLIPAPDYKSAITTFDTIEKFSV